MAPRIKMKEQIPAIKMKASKMKNYHKHLVLAAIGLFMSPMILPLRAASTEADQIKLLAPANSDRTITSAMTQLERMHTKNASCTNAIPALKLLLADNRSPVRRKAGRILGIFHAPLTDAELRQLCTQLKADDWGEVQSCLKALRDLGIPAAVPDILPCLKHTNPNVVRDACRTLAVLGDKSAIPAIEPLLASSNGKIKQDAQDAIDSLKLRP